MTKSCCFTGHRPKYFNNNYNIKDEFYYPFIDRISEEIESLIVNENVTIFISGGALGIDMLSFFCVHKLKEKYPNIKNCLAMPFSSQGHNWFDRDKELLKLMYEIADVKTNVDEEENYKVGSPGYYSPVKLQRRNEFMVDHSDFVIAVWNGEKSGTKNCIDYAKKHDKQIVHIKVNNGGIINGSI